MPITNIDDRRGEKSGRRDSDSHTCVFHQDMKDQTANCFIAVMDRVKTLEVKMSGIVTVKIAGIITTVAMGFLILFIGAAFNMMRDLRMDVRSVNEISQKIEERFDTLNNEQIRIGSKQENVLLIIAELKEGQVHIKEQIAEMQKVE